MLFFLWQPAVLSVTNCSYFCDYDNLLFFLRQSVVLSVTNCCTFSEILLYFQWQSVVLSVTICYSFCDKLLFFFCDNLLFFIRHYAVHVQVCIGSGELGGDVHDSAHLHHPVHPGLHGQNGQHRLGHETPSSGNQGDQSTIRNGDWRRSGPAVFLFRWFHCEICTGYEPKTAAWAAQCSFSTVFYTIFLNTEKQFMFSVQWELTICRPLDYAENELLKSKIYFGRIYIQDFAVKYAIRI